MDNPKTDAGWGGYSYDMVGLSEAWSAGYTGKGMLVAVLDTGLDLEYSSFFDPKQNNNHDDGLEDGDNVTGIRRTHEAFRDNSFKSYDDLEKGNGKNFLNKSFKDEKTAIATIKEKTSALHITTTTGVTSAESIYKNRKVPFAYDYSNVVVADESGESWAIIGDPNVYPGPNGETHGTHVAGTIAGYVKQEDGEVKFSGVAPDAQLLIMKVFPDEGGGAQDPSILNALEDAITLGADVVNLSLGSDNGFADNDNIVRTAYEKAKNAGVTMMTSAGNSSYAGEKNKKSEKGYPATNPDMSRMSAPAVNDENLAVASINNTVEAVSELTWVSQSDDYYNGGYGGYGDYGDSGSGKTTEHKIAFYDPNSVSFKGKFTDDAIQKFKNKYDSGGGDFKNGIPIIYAGYGRASYTNEYGVEASDFDEFWSPEDSEGSYKKTGIALIMRGMPEGSDEVLSFADKVNNALTHAGKDSDGVDRGVLGVIIYDPKASTNEDMLYISIEGGGLPAISISGKAGAELAEAVGIYAYSSQAWLKSVEQDDKVISSKTGKEMSTFSSWGAGPGLELKPEITAPGGNIWSTVLDMSYVGGQGFYTDYTGAYGMMSGTSMAAPHMAGLAAVVKQYVIEKQNSKASSNKTKDSLMELLLVSTAVPQKKTDGTYYSPRLQGAGLVDVAAAVKTPAYIEVNGQNVGKIELGDQVPNNFDLSFTVKNLTAGSLTYSAQAYVMRPQTANDNGTEIVTADDVLICTTGETNITVPGNSQANATVHVDISSKTAEIDKIFPNGTYIEGFVVLTPKNSSDAVQIGLPFLGFRGDWTKAPILDTATWLDGCKEGEVQENWTLDQTSPLNSDYLWMPSLFGYYDGYNFYNLGQNLFDPDAPTNQTVFHRENVAISPDNGDSAMNEINDIELYQIRDAKVLVAEVRDKTSGELYWRGTMPFVPRSGYDANYDAVIPNSLYYATLNWAGQKILEDGTSETLPNDTICTYTLRAFGEGTYQRTSEGMLNFDNIDLTKPETWPKFDKHYANSSAVGSTDTDGNEISFDILIDTAAPELVGNSVSLKEEGDKVLMTFSVKDNGALASVNVVPYVTQSQSYDYGEENDRTEQVRDEGSAFEDDYIYDPGVKNRKFTVDITNYVHKPSVPYESSTFTWDTGVLNIDCCDYAGNQRTYAVKVKDDEGQFLTGAGLHISQSSARLHVGSELDLSVINNSGEKVGSAVIFESSNPEIASVDKYGHVTALTPGQTIVTALTPGGLSIDRCVVVVVAENTEVLDFDLSITKFNGLKAGNHSFEVRVENLQPADVKIESIRWETFENDSYDENWVGITSVEQNTEDGLSGNVTLTQSSAYNLENPDLHIPGGSGRLDVTINNVTRSLPFTWEDVYQDPEGQTDDDLISDVGIYDQTVYVEEGESTKLFAKFRTNHDAIPVRLAKLVLRDDENESDYKIDNPQFENSEGLQLDGPSWVAPGAQWQGKLVNEVGYALPEKISVWTYYPPSDGEEYGYAVPLYGAQGGVDGAFTYNQSTGDITVYNASPGGECEMIICAEATSKSGNPAGVMSDTTYPDKPTPTYGPFDWKITEGVEGTLDVYEDEYNDRSGVTFTPSSPGVTYITATSSKENYSINFAVVCEPRRAETITLSEKELELTIKQSDKHPTATLTAILTPEDITQDRQKEIIWTSYNPDVATVDANGKVTAISEGYAYVLAQVKTNSNIMATCIVHVTEESEEEIVDTIVGDPEVDAGNIPAEQREAITGALAKTVPDVSALSAVASRAARIPNGAVEMGRQALREAGIEFEEDNVRIVAETFLKIKAKDYKASGDDKTLSVDISAAYRLIATTAADNNAIIEEGDGKNSVKLSYPERELIVDSPIKLWVGLPAGFTTEESLYVQHTKSNIHYHLASILELTDGDLMAYFNSSDGLSPFVFSTSFDPEARIGDMYYERLADAVDAAKDGDEIQLLKDVVLDGDILVSREVQFSVDLNGKTITGGSIKAGSGYTATVEETADGKITYTFTANKPGRPNRPGNSGNNGNINYNITIDSGIVHGTVLTNHTFATRGTSVTLTVRPDDGYALETLTVTDSRSQEIGVTKSGDETYFFVMPDSDVTVFATFTAVNGPTPLPESGYGSLQVTKTVTGSKGDVSREWHFRVELNNGNINGQYGDMVFTNGVAEFTLKHGQSIIALNLPNDIAYKVIEQEAGSDGYTTRMTGAEGTIPDGGTASAEFVNDKPSEMLPQDNLSNNSQGNSPNNPGNNPDTGDNSHIDRWYTVMVLSLGVIVTMLGILAWEKRTARAKSRQKRQ